MDVNSQDRDETETFALIDDRDETLRNSRTLRGVIKVISCIVVKVINDGKRPSIST